MLPVQLAFDRIWLRAVLIKTRNKKSLNYV
jgi:hypothetical protein